MTDMYFTKKQKILNKEKRASKIVSVESLQRLSSKLKKQGKTIVFVTGSFDLLNAGHCRYLAEAKSHGDVLVVGVASDVSERETKGETFPLINEEIRAELLCFLRVVDYVTVVDEKHAYGAIALLQPDIFFTHQKDWERNIRNELETFVTSGYGGKVVTRMSKSSYYGTKNLIDHIANIRVIQLLESYLKERFGDFEIDPKKHLLPADYGEQLPKYENSFNANKTIVGHDLAGLARKLKKRKKTVAFVSGSYDLLHVGHARFIEQAGLLCDILVVGIPTDKSLREIKGLGRPVIAQHSRAYVLGHLDSVNYVVYYDWNVRSVLSLLQPDVFFTVLEEWNKGYKNSEEGKIVTKYGGKVVTSERQAPFLSASAMIDRLALNKVKEIFAECMDEERYKRILGEKSALSA